MKLIDKEIQDFIRANLDADWHSLLLKKSPFEGITMQEIVEQIQGRKIAEKKLHFLLEINAIYPPKLNLEQTSSEATAKYKAQYFRGEKFIDLTCGFGIDAYFLSQNFEEISLVEQNETLLNLVKYNWNLLGKKANFINKKLENFLETTQESFDLIYLDPARRDANKQKIFLLEDLSPNVLEIQERLFGLSKKILIKLSPLIDIKYLTSVLNYISEIKIVAVRNDVKEVLVLQEFGYQGEIKITAVNLETNEPEVSFYLSENENIEFIFSEVKKYLYIPSNAVMKSGAFGVIMKQFGLYKLEKNTHFYTSDEYIEDFPGRILEVKLLNSKEIEKGGKYNIISKNYPLKPEEIKKKYKIKDGGNQYLIFTQSIQGKIILKSS